jgi:hypothetical protein
MPSCTVGNFTRPLYKNRSNRASVFLPYYLRSDDLSEMIKFSPISLYVISLSLCRICSVHNKSSGLFSYPRGSRSLVFHRK